MSDIEREEFEQAVTDRWSDSYSFTRFGDEDYYDEIVEGMWRGWQASRQALEGEPVGTARRCGYDRDITYCDFEADEVPIGTKLYTHPARQAVSVPGDEYIRALQDLVIKQGEMLSAIVNIVKGPPAENSLHSTHDVVEGVRKLNALVWGGDKEVFVLRKQAEAIDYVLSDIEIMLWHGVEFVAVSNIEYYANTLRAEANAEGGGGN